MKQVNRTHLAGLELVLTELQSSLHRTQYDQLTGLIAQASAAPEQAPAAWIKSGKPDPYLTADGRYAKLWPEQWTPLYTHADPSEVERLLIAECWQACGGNGPATKEELLSALRLMNEVEDEQDAAIKATTQPAEVKS